MGNLSCGQALASLDPYKAISEMPIGIDLFIAFNLIFTSKVHLAPSRKKPSSIKRIPKHKGNKKYIVGQLAVLCELLLRLSLSEC